MINGILIALLVVASVGIIAGVLLALASHFFGIEDDPKVKMIRDVLPGANCGACGYAGCDSYAEAVAAGKAEPNLCIPGAKSVAEKLSEVLGVEVQAGESKVAFVGCNGNSCATCNKADYAGHGGCAAAKLVFGGPAACVYGCIGCGDCAAVCTSDAICIKDGLAHIDSSACIGCGRCVAACPNDIIKMIPVSSKVVVMCNNTEKGVIALENCENACIGCKKCQRNCSENAITVVNNLAIIDYDKCNGCGTCAECCIAGCIKILPAKQ